MKYFRNCRTAEELKKDYRKLAMKLHPDIVGGDGEAFKEMQAEFEKLWERLKDIHQTAEGKTYTAKQETTETPKEFIHIINVLITLVGVEVEICGKWIWVSGDTKPHRETLKQLKFKWAHKKQAWYYHAEPYRKKSHVDFTLDEIRDMFGSKRYDQKQEEEKKLKAVI
ncbi:MAG: DnaJ domain-containing protein [Ruminococcus sp.]|nr:DnaJ domain-containing protein [Ruminococcus sp.]